MVVPIISVVGKSNSGKTTLVEKIIPELKKRGYKVGAIKHDVHQFEIDHKGKDSWKMSHAGADTVVIASNEKMAMVKKLDFEVNIDDIVTRLFNDVDIVITEGYKRQNKPKIEVIRYGELLMGECDNLIAIIDNAEKKGTFHIPVNLNEVPILELWETEKIVDFIEKKISEETYDSLNQQLNEVIEYERPARKGNRIS